MANDCDAVLIPYALLASAVAKGDLIEATLW